MRDRTAFGIVSLLTVLGAYAIYAITNPGIDGAVFATALAAITGVMSYVIGRAVSDSKKDQA